MRTAVKFGLLGAGATVIAFAVSMPLMAQDHRGFDFEKVDTNGDGFLDQAEMDAAREVRFASMDADGDGALTTAEMTAHRAKMMEEHDGGAHRAGAFKTLDTDGNGALSEAEFNAGMDKRHGEMKDHGDKRQAQMMQKMDTNKDGKITKDELGGEMQARMLKRLDTDGDGRISKDEAAKMKMHKK
jgi:Ca2+-binding EF-hand superfamily protein